MAKQREEGGHQVRHSAGHKGNCSVDFRRLTNPRRDAGEKTRAKAFLARPRVRRFDDAKELCFSREKDCSIEWQRGGRRRGGGEGR